MIMEETKTILQTSHRLRYTLIIEGFLVGGCAGIISIVYRQLLAYAEEWVQWLSTMMRQSVMWAAAGFVLLALIALGISLLLRHEPLISGSGIPQIEAEVSGHLDERWFRVLWSKMAAGVLAALGGLSLGREGPSIQLGGMCGKGFGKIFRRVSIEQRYLITCGAAAGLSAAFNAPLAGVMFALEEVHRSFSMSVIVSVMTASVTGDFLSQYVFGLAPAFHFDVVRTLPLDLYAIVIGLGILCGAMAACYNFLTLKAQDWYARIPFLKPAQRVIIPLMVSGILMLVLPQVLGSGHSMSEALADGPRVPHVLLLLLLAKFAFSTLSFGSGAAGGIFFPMLVLGSYLGGAFGSALSEAGIVDAFYVNNFIIMGMAGLFSGIVRAPVTGIILIAEMTGTLSHLLPLCLVSVTAYITAHLLHSRPIYESLLERLLAGRGSAPERGSAGKLLFEVVVEAGSQLEQRRISEVSWPQHCLLVAVRRGEEEILPRGDTMIQAQDTLVALLDEPSAAFSQEMLQRSAQGRL